MKDKIEFYCYAAERYTVLYKESSEHKRALLNIKKNEMYYYRMAVNHLTAEWLNHKTRARFYKRHAHLVQPLLNRLAELRTSRPRNDLIKTLFLMAMELSYQISFDCTKDLRIERLFPGVKSFLNR